MKFITAFRASHALLINLGFFALWVADILPFIAIVLTVVGYFVSERIGVRRFVDAAPVWLLNLITLAVFAYMVGVHFLAKNDLVVALVYFTVYLQVVKLFGARKNRDYFQIYILAISHLVLSTLLTSDLLFAVPFLLFIVSAPWCLTLYNLKAQAEDAFKEDAEVKTYAAGAPGKRLFELFESRRAISGGFFWSTTVLSLLLLVNTAAIFAFFPRVSSGFLFRNTRYGHSVSGFSDKVDLRSFGLIKGNTKVVMRVIPKSRSELNASGLYWRGLCFDTYDGLEWHRSKTTARRLPLTRTYGEIPIRRHDPDGLVEHEVRLERLDTDVFFALHRVEYVKWDRAYVDRVFQRQSDDSPAGPALAVDAYGGLHFDGGLEYERHYRAFSDTRMPPPKDLRQASQGALSDEQTKSSYMQLPEMSQRFHDLAKQITEGRDNNYDRLYAVMGYLLKNNEYTLDVPRHKGNPIEGFLFDKREGHCEFFATTTVLLLRAAGVPARLVSGFRGGDWNEYGEFLTVRQRDAHTWVEVYFEGHGWLPFDPTPPDSSALGYRDLTFKGWTHFIESLELTWHGYVVNYELRDQEKMVGGVAASLTAAFKRFEGLTRGMSLRDLVEWLRDDRPRVGVQAGGRPVLIWVCLSVGGLIVVLLIRGRWRRASHRVLSRACTRFVSIAAGHGYAREGGETIQELSMRVAMDVPQLRELLGRFVDVYYAQRFGPVRVAQGDAVELDETLDTLQVAWKASKMNS
jgi:transglutaminase-like putative cysteine protease